MRNALARPIIETLLDHHARGRSWRAGAPTQVPAAHYTSATHLERERQELLRALPQVVALGVDLPGPGTTLTRDKLGIPVVLTRDEHGVARALANVCAHRGSQVVADGRGEAKRLTCPYHAWSYRLDGTQVALPDASAFDVELPRQGLTPLPLTEENGLLWLTPQLGAPEPAPSLGAIADDLDAFGLEGHRHWRSHRFELPLNWKLVIDTFLEGYHFASLHRNTVGPLFLSNLSHAERFGSHVREVIPRKSLLTLADEPPESWNLVPHSALVYVLFPSTVFVVQIDHVETWRVVPEAGDPGRSTCDLDFYVPDVPATESSERHWELNWKLTIDTVIEEDFHAMAGVQRGLESGALEFLTIGANEPALACFHASLGDALEIGLEPKP